MDYIDYLDYILLSQGAPMNPVEQEVIDAYEVSAEVSAWEQILLWMNNDLSEAQRGAITLTKIQGLSRREAARILQVSQEDITSLINSGMQKLKRRAAEAMKTAKEAI